MKKICFMAVGNAKNINADILTAHITECGELGEGVHDSQKDAEAEAQQYISPSKVYKVTLIFEEVSEC